MEKNSIEKIIQKIKVEKIVPESKWMLNWKSYVFWIVWIFTLILGAIFFSFIILNLLDIHPAVIRQLGLGKIFFLFFKTAPYLWIILAILTIGSGFLAIRKTKRGYRYSIIFITSTGVLLISLLGGFLHLAKINRHLGDRMFIPGSMSREMAYPMEKRWRVPGEGRLGGEILISNNRDNFKLRDFDEKVWEINYSAQTRIRGIKELNVGMWVEIIGEKSSGTVFRADFIQPFPFERKINRENK
ncbi:MAG: hypothetical protein WAV16_03390 [Candidatus Moraniibacteriota bacterium]